jgi:hypothetical protein
MLNMCRLAVKLASMSKSSSRIPPNLRTPDQEPDRLSTNNQVRIFSDLRVERWNRIKKEREEAVRFGCGAMYAQHDVHTDRDRWRERCVACMPNRAVGAAGRIERDLGPTVLLSAML